MEGGLPWLPKISLIDFKYRLPIWVILSFKLLCQAGCVFPRTLTLVAPMTTQYYKSLYYIRYVTLKIKLRKPASDERFENDKNRQS